MNAPIAANLSILGASESYCWLLSCAHVGSNTRPARLTIAALKDEDNHRACDEAVSWLAEVAFSDGEASVWAAEILQEVA